MTEKAHDQELDALKADIARLRDEITSLAASAKANAGAKTAATGEEGQDHGEYGFSTFADLLDKLATSRVQGEKVVKGLADEVEQHPLVSVLAAFGFGYLVAKLWHQGDKQ
jgi:ElaB/YqjD/DUF883 family membrane-anchored ribosome-binding protein